MKKELLPLDAEERVRRIKKSIRGEDSYQPYQEYKLMEQFSIGYNELMSFPYEKYLEYSKIISLENKEKKKKQNRAEDKANSKI